MALNSFKFMIFLAAVVFVYYVVPKKLQWAVLLVASYGFYLASGVDNVAYIIATTLFTYYSSHWMQKIRDKQNDKIKALGDEITKDERMKMKKEASNKIKRIQFLTVIVNLLVLAYFKYLNFFIGGINSVFSIFEWDASLPLVNILAPLGLSYYTFNSIGYLIDVGRGKLKAEAHLGKFALFVSFFPSIVQGPLNRYGDVGLQLQKEHEFDYNNVKFGAQLILWGLFKKMVIADRIAAIPATIFSSSFEDYTGSHIFFAVLCYSFQIYGDFSGGTDITRGAAQMMGIDLPVNFERPFFATSMADFWRRWHMSLGAWMREYVFYPVMLCKPVASLSKKMRKKHGTYAGKLVPSVAAPMVVFFLIGIWHGLSWQYITNGLYNALLISGSVAMTPVFDKMIKGLKVNTEAYSFKIFQMLRTTLLLFISRIIVRAPSITEAGRMIKAFFTDFDFNFLLGIDGRIYELGVTKEEMSLLLVSIAVLTVISILQENGMKIRETLSKQNILFRWAIILALIVFIVVFGTYGPAYDAKSFIYGAF